MQMQVGKRVVTRAVIDYQPHAHIGVGETGRVVGADDDEVHVRWDRQHEGLRDWANETLLLPCEASASLRPWPYPSHRAVKRSVLAGSVALLCAYMAFDIAVTAKPTPPIEVLGAWAEPSEVEPGGELRICFDAIHHRACRVKVDRMIVDATQTTVWRSRHLGAGQAVTSYPLRRCITLPVPDGLAPGRYGFSSVLSSHCGGAEEFVTTQPAALFTVLSHE